MRFFYPFSTLFLPFFGLFNHLLPFFALFNHFSPFPPFFTLLYHFPPPPIFTLFYHLFTSILLQIISFTHFIEHFRPFFHSQVHNNGLSCRGIPKQSTSVCCNDTMLFILLVWRWSDHQLWRYWRYCIQFGLAQIPTGITSKHSIHHQ